MYTVEVHNAENERYQEIHLLFEKGFKPQAPL